MKKMLINWSVLYVELALHSSLRLHDYRLMFMNCAPLKMSKNVAKETSIHSVHTIGLLETLEHFTT